MPTINDKLEDWKDIAKDFAGASLLLGNGASRAMWEDFKYESLLKATQNNSKHKLKPEDYQLFKTLKTGNFEQVLGTLQAAITACEALGANPSIFEEPYARIRAALGEAVKRAHVPWGTVSEERLKLLSKALSRYDYVYTTNYDLLVYWAVMQDPYEFKDYFWNRDNKFDMTDVEVRGKYTKLVYLHGALHLYRAKSGEVWKATKGFGAALLDQFPDAFGAKAEPLLISEAKSADKLRSIYGSDYLSFAYSLFTKHTGPLVVFGQGLSESDQHLVDAINSWPSAKLAISLRDGISKEVRQRKAQLEGQLPDADIVYFKARTHPLGSEKLRVEKA